MANNALNQAFNTAAKKMKADIASMKKAAKKAGMEKVYGVNGPMGELAIDAIFPGAPDELYEDLLSKDERAKNIRLVYKRTMAKGNPDEMPTSARRTQMNDYMGNTSTEETFLKIANAAKEVKGKGDVVEAIVTKAQNTEELKSRVKANKRADEVTGVEADVAEVRKMNPTSSTTVSMAETIRASGEKGMEELAKSKKELV